MFDWESLISTKRWGFESRASNIDATRTEFHRDYDRIIFSSAFRRLQNKTQVFPLPGSVFVHNRLTHSLEVASVGRSLGLIISNFLIKNKLASQEQVSELGTLVSVASLAHDLGNPPFGHSGEKAISRYFKEGDGKTLRTEVDENEWHDLINFEGNANTLRILTHLFKGKGKFSLTYATLASLVKYPCNSQKVDKNHIHTKKYGYFSSEKESFLKIAKEVGLKAINEDSFVRHPLVYLVEAADDICYNIIDLEDAHRLKILTENEVLNLYKAIVDQLQADKSNRYFNEILPTFTDANDRVSFIRAIVINLLIQTCAQTFYDNIESIANGSFNTSLFDGLQSNLQPVLKEIENISVNKVYNYPSSVEIELAGYKVLGGLLEEFVPAVLYPKSPYEKKLVHLIPDQFITNGESVYHKIQSVIDFVSGMTDLYAVDLYKKVKGISI